MNLFRRFWNLLIYGLAVGAGVVAIYQGVVGVLAVTEQDWVMGSGLLGIGLASGVISSLLLQFRMGSG